VDEVWSDPPSLRSSSVRDQPSPGTRQGRRAREKHLFVEKPLGVTAAASVSMAGKSNAPVCSSPPAISRTDPKHLFLKEQIAGGAFAPHPRLGLELPQRFARRLVRRKTQ
jgi:hypothetical protein